MLSTCAMGPVKPVSATELRGSNRFAAQRMQLAQRVVAPSAHNRHMRVLCSASKPSESAAAKALAKVAGTAGAVTLALALGASSPALASDSAKVGKCLFSKCQTELASCIADEKCLESLVCLNKCEIVGKDISSCQIKCGDLYSDAATATFNTCAVTENNCVPQIPDDGSIKIPDKKDLVQEFSTSDFDGKWYIASGLNKLFDIFDCQVHYFNAPESDKLYAKLNWRVNKSDGQFYERSDVQTFVQDPETPGILYNHDNEFLHYTDDWYIVAQKPDNYIFVYYRGSNDAWDGYGGAVIYSRTQNLDPEVIPEIREAAARVGLSYDAFTANDNTCGPAPKLKVVKPTDLDTLFDDVLAIEGVIAREISLEVNEVKDEFTRAEKSVFKEVSSELRSLDAALENDLVSFSRGFTVFKDQLIPNANATPEELQAYKEKAKEQKRAEKVLQRVENPSFFSQIFANLFGRK